MLEAREIYDTEFYKAQNLLEQSLQEALRRISQILPSINNCIDVGCGVGVWLKAWQTIQPEINIYGIDFNVASDSVFAIPRNNYQKVDLRDSAKEIYDKVIFEIREKELFEISGNKPFDLVQSFEVAEHLEEKYADNFIYLLTLFSNKILFSAALPMQGGTHHVNERLPKYWARIFAKYGYECFDICRKELFDMVINNDLQPWYGQNMFLYIHKSCSDEIQTIKKRGGMIKNSEPQTVLLPPMADALYERLLHLEKKNQKRISYKIRHFLRKIRGVDGK